MAEYQLEAHPEMAPKPDGLERSEDKGIRSMFAGVWLASGIYMDFKPATPPILTKGARAVVIGGINYSLAAMNDAKILIGFDVGEDGTLIEVAPMDIIEETDLIIKNSTFKTTPSGGTFFAMSKVPLPRYVQLIVQGQEGVVELAIVSGVQLLF
jgi:hypothetical protein